MGGCGLPLSVGQTSDWVNPYDTRAPLELSTQYQHYWVDRQGRIVGTDDPTADDEEEDAGIYSDDMRGNPEVAIWNSVLRTFAIASAGPRVSCIR
jgi:hypothetical protein